MDPATYQETMRLLAKIDKKAKQEREEREERMTPYEKVKCVLLTLILIGIYSLCFYLD